MAFAVLPTPIEPSAPHAGVATVAPGSLMASGVVPVRVRTESTGGLRAVLSLLSRHRALTLLSAELGVILVALVVVGSKVPGLVDSLGRYLGELRHPSPFALGAAVLAEGISLFAVTLIPRLLVSKHHVNLRRRDAFAVGLTANGMSVVLPGGSVPSSVWLAHQLSRRGAKPTLAAWVVLAGGFSATVTLFVILLIGAGLASVISPLLTVALLAVVLAAAVVFVALVHRVDTLAAWSDRQDGEGVFLRSVDRFVGLAAEATQWRAGWQTGAQVLLASSVNWLADAVCLIAVFDLAHASVPWRTVLVAYAAGQLLGAVVPLPGGLGAVEGGLVGTLVALGSPAGPVIIVVALYRLIGYWLPAAAALPAYTWARHQVLEAPESMLPGSMLPDLRMSDVTVSDVTVPDMVAPELIVLGDSGRQVMCLAC